MKVAISICASAKYQICLAAQAMAIQQNIFACSEITEGHLILVTCEKPVEKYLKQYRELLGDKWTVHHIPLALEDKEKSYDKSAQNIIDSSLYWVGKS